MTQIFFNPDENLFIKKNKNIKKLQWESSNAIYQWFSECVPWTSNLSLTWELVRMQILGPHPDLLNQKPWEWRPEICVLTSPLWDADGWWSVRSLEIENEHSSGCGIWHFQATASALSLEVTGSDTHAVKHTTHCPSLLAYAQISGHALRS